MSNIRRVFSEDIAPSVDRLRPVVEASGLSRSPGARAVSQAMGLSGCKGWLVIRVSKAARIQCGPKAPKRYRCQICLSGWCGPCQDNPGGITRKEVLHGTPFHEAAGHPAAYASGEQATSHPKVGAAYSAEPDRAERPVLDSQNPLACRAFLF